MVSTRIIVVPALGSYTEGGLSGVLQKVRMSCSKPAKQDFISSTEFLGGMPGGGVPHDISELIRERRAAPQVGTFY